MKRGRNLFSLLMVLVMLITVVLPLETVFAATYTVNYELYGASNPGLAASYDDSEKTLGAFLNEQPEPELEGYGFLGWYYESEWYDGYNKADENSSVYNTPTYDEGYIDIFAGYAPAATFYASGAASDGTDVSNTFSGSEAYKLVLADGDPNFGFEQSVLFTETPETIANYEFAYYYEESAPNTDASDGSGNYAVSEITTIDDAPGNVDWSRPDSSNAIKVYKAKYNALYTFDANGGSWTGNVTLRQDTPNEIEADEPENGTRALLGWLKSDLTTEISYSEMSAEPAGATFYAKWEKIVPTYTLPTGLTAIYGDTLSDIDLSAYTTSDGSFSWVDGATEVGDVGVRTHRIKYTPTDTVNYNVDEADVAVTVSPAVPIIETVPDASAVEKGESLNESTLSGGTVKGVKGEALEGSFSWKDSSKTLDTVGDVNGNEVVFTPDSTNYNTAECTVMVRVKEDTPSSPSSSGGGTTRYTIDASAGAGGKILPVGKIRVVKGNNSKFVITPEEGYAIDILTIDGEQVEAAPEYTFENVRTYHSINVTFKESAEVTDDNNAGSSLGFNRSIHMAYLEGYEDNKFLPDKNLTRAEAAAIICRVLSEPINPEKDYPSSFTDISDDEWYAQYVGYIEGLGLIKGYKDGTFRPDALITRAEIVTIFCRIESGDVTYADCFKDVQSTHWAAKSISYAYVNGWVNGYPDGTFRPDLPVTRAEVAKIMNKVLSRSVSETGYDGFETKSFADVSPSHWAYNEIIEATNAHGYIIKDGGTEQWTELLKD